MKKYLFTFLCLILLTGCSSDKVSKKIVECLIKNHDYKEHSEVFDYKRRLMK